MTRWSWLLGAAVLTIVLWHTGTGPVVLGIGSLDAQTLLLGALLAVPTTVASAWRWRLVARALGTELPLGPAVVACYRSQLLNASLPAGVVGDVVRGVQQGRATGDPVRGLRSVVWERSAGQVVQAGVAVAVLALLPSPLRPPWPVLVAVVAAVGTVLLVARQLRVLPSDRAPGRVAATFRSDLRGLRDRRCWRGVLATSLVAVLGHVTTYVLAARAVGVTAPLAALAPLVLLVLVAAGLPANLAGWGPREGMAVWAFAAAGLGAEAGLASAVAYGAIVLVACLPGAVLLLSPALAPPVPRGVRG